LMHGTHPITKFAKNYFTDGFIRFTRADRNAVSMVIWLIRNARQQLQLDHYCGDEYPRCDLD
jgi:hypothetical protein